MSDHLARILVFGLTVSWILASPGPCPAADPPVVAYGYATPGLSQENEEAFLVGFRIGLDSTGARANVVVDLAVTDDPFDTVRVARRLLDRNPVVLVGFPTSREALLAFPEAKRRGVVSIFPAAGHTELGRQGPLVYSTGDTMEASVRATLELIRTQFGGENGLILVHPSNPISRDGAAIFRQQLGGDFRDVAATILEVNAGGELPASALEDMKRGTRSYVVITFYPSESGLLLRQMAENQLELPIVAVSSWTTGDITLLRRMLVARTSPTYSVAVWVKGMEPARGMEAQVADSIYGIPMSSYVAYGYDAGVVVGTVINRMGDRAGPSAFADAFHESLCFDGCFTGRLCFPPNGGQAARPSRFVKFEPKAGWVEFCTEPEAK